MSVLTIFISLISTLLLLLYVFHNHVIRLLSRLTHVWFFLGFTGMLSIVFIPYAYANLVDSWLATTYLGAELQSLDASLSQIREGQDTVQGWWDQLIGDDEDEEVIVESTNYYGSFLSFLSACVTLLVGVISLLMMLLSLYFKYTFIGFIGVSKAMNRIKKLESKV